MIIILSNNQNIRYWNFFLKKRENKKKREQKKKNFTIENLKFFNLYIYVHVYSYLFYRIL